jgi:hypothetical protein
MTSLEKSISTEPPRALVNRRVEAAVVVPVAVIPAVVGIAVLYGAQLSIAAVFLVLGWFSIVATGWLLYRAAVSFSLDVADTATLAGRITDARRAELEREKKILLKAIKEIEFDHETGKLDDQDAAEITQKYRGRALEIIRLLDEEKAHDYDAVIEKELAKRLAREEGATAGEPAAPAAAEAKDAAAPTLKPEVSTEPVDTRCPKCDIKNDLDAVFCKKCGARLGS